MKIAETIPRRQNFTGRGFMPAPIAIQREEEPAVDSSKLITFKCRNDPNDPSSTTFEIKLQPFDGSGSVEQWFRFKKKTEQVIKGQNLTTGPMRYALWRRVLTGKALTTFDQAAAARGNETVEHLLHVVQAVTDYVLPVLALPSQKRYMRRIARKPAEMSMKEYIARYAEVNDYLAQFNAVAGEANKLPADEVLEHAEFAIPSKWRQQMVLQGFEPLSHSLEDLTEFCERLEFSESMMETTHVSAKKVKFNNDKPPKGKGAPQMDNSKAAKRNDKPSHYCHYHGPNWSHDTNECKVVISQAKKMSAAHGHDSKQNGNNYRPSSTSSSSKYDSSNKPRFGNKTWKRSDNEQSKKELHAELHTMIKQMVEQTMTNKNGKKRRATDPPVREDFNYNQEFENLSISDTDEE
jgi:hypothetical protein